MNIYDGFLRLPVKAEEIRLTGGLSQSEVWRQTIADVFEAEVIPVMGEETALGAAIHAAWVWHKENGRKISLNELVDSFVQLDEFNRKKSLPKNVNAYRFQKRLFHALSARLRGQGGEDPFTVRMDMLS